MCIFCVEKAISTVHQDVCTIWQCTLYNSEEHECDLPPSIFPKNRSDLVSTNLELIECGAKSVPCVCPVPEEIVQNGGHKLQIPRDSKL
ncbi:hypothetical protein AVEN_203220-1 [Araneus ventricosus]|uniref:Uncharacterized protein n=1 Tax=Araneus ventricosus TaxID=182803 RepID=A0A4Y2F110_ARAVE|nr:hypothetical protein AVEN_203220-1 [Araneus ventricosus]